MTKKVTIIVAVYNAEETIERCINSLLSQTYKNIEIIIINDGSTDCSGEKIDRYYKNTKQIKIIHQENLGVANARNKGLKKASGDYIMFLDSDDYLKERCLEEVISKSRKHNVDITRFKFTYLYKNGRQKVEKDHFPSGRVIEKKDFPKLIYNKVLTGIKINSICKTLYKKEIIQDTLFNEDMITAEDLIFNMAVFTNAKNFLYLPYPYYYYYKSGKSLTGYGISLFTKYKYNYLLTTLILQYLKKWDMYKIRYIIKALLRPLYVTISKIKRSVLKDV